MRRPNGIDCLTNKDERQFESIAADMIDAGLWDRIERSSETGLDSFAIHRPDSGDPALSVGRCQNGRYFAMEHVTGAVRFGRTLSEALASIAHLPEAVLPN